MSRKRVGDRFEHVQRQRLAIHHVMDHFSDCGSTPIAPGCGVRHRMMFL